MNRFFATSLLVCFTALCYSGEEAKPDLKISLEKKEDSLEVAFKSTGWVADLNSQSGIGSVTLTLTKGEWPEKLRLTTNLHNLESGGISTAGLSAHIKLKSGGFAYAQSLNDKGMPEKMLAVTFEITAKLVDGRVELEIPLRKFAGTNTEVSIGWIDAFRR